MFLRLHPRQHRAENLVAGAAGPRFLHRDVLHRVGVGERALEAGGRVGFAGAQDVGVVLRVGVQARDRDADVAVEDVARLDDRIVAELVALHALPLHRHARLEPGAESLVVDPLPPPPHQVARARRARHDHLLREHRLRHLPDERGHLFEERFLFRQPRRDQVRAAAPRRRGTSTSRWRRALRSSPAARRSKGRR